MRSGQAAVAVVIGLAASAALGSDPRELGRVTANAALVIDARSGQVLFARNPTLPVPPASTTKVLTALIALRHLSPDAVLPVSAHASSMPAAKVWLKKGWQLSARDLLYALLLRSANDASVVIAEGIAGSVPGFARLMNETARALGATQSNFVTPNGLPAANHYATARDMALILRAALATPGMRDILSTRTAVIQPISGSRRSIALRSTNRLLWRDDVHVIGKTGWTRQAKRCFVGAAGDGGREVIVSVLGSSDLWGDVEILAAYGLAQQPPGDWTRYQAWQQAAAPSALQGTGWSRPPGGTIEDLPAVATAPRVGEGERPATRKGRTAASAGHRQPSKLAARPRVNAAPQGDGGELARAKLRYALHLGSFRSKARAEQLRAVVAKRGYPAAIEPVAGNFLVTVPSFPSRDAARKAARALGRTLRVDPVIVASK